MLIERKARIDTGFPNGDHALHLAARRNLPQVIELLAARGTDVETTNTKKATPLEVAAEAGAVEAVKALLKCGAKTSPAVLAAAKKKNDPKVQELLNAKP